MKVLRATREIVRATLETGEPLVRSPGILLAMVPSVVLGQSLEYECTNLRRFPYRPEDRSSGHEREGGHRQIHGIFCEDSTS